MERDLRNILHVDERANEKLAKTISDYARERWAAGRKVLPHFWRPVSPFINGDLLDDIKKLFESDDEIDQKAGVLSCYYSKLEDPKKLLATRPDLVALIKKNELSWETI